MTSQLSYSHINFSAIIKMTKQSSHTELTLTWEYPVSQSVTGLSPGKEFALAKITMGLEDLNGRVWIILRITPRKG